jgi:uncharacterized protein YdhG (YjbR/CyaY superfamily)
MKAKSTAATKKRYEGFSAGEKAAMAERVKEMKVRGRVSQADEENMVLEKIAELPEGDRSLARRIHAVIKAGAPLLAPKLWYGMPAYYKDGKYVCHFQAAHKFKTRYATLGFGDAAHLDEGTMWPVVFALPKKLSAEDEARITALVKKAVS